MCAGAPRRAARITAARSDPATRPGLYLKYCVGFDGVFMRAASRALTPCFLVLFVLGYLQKLSMCSRLPCRRKPFREDPSRKALQSYGEFSEPANFSQLFFEPANRDRHPGVTSLEGRCRPPPRRPLLSESGCKGTHFPHTLQIFMRLFLRKFTKKRRTH